MNTAPTRIVQRQQSLLPKRAFLGLLSWLTLSAFVFAVAGRTRLPARYSFDGKFIQAIAQGRPYVIPDPGFARTGAIYRALGLSHHPQIVAVLGVVLMAIAVSLALRGRMERGLATAPVAFTFAAFGLTAIYLTWFSKDVLTLALVIGVLVVGERTRTDVLIFLLLIGYGALFRPYWFIVAFGYVVFRVSMSRISSRGSPARAPRSGDERFVLLKCLLVAFGMLVIAGGAYYLRFGETLGSLRNGINENRLGSADAATAIETFIVGAGLLQDTLNAFTTLLSILFPIPLLALGGLVHALSAILISLGTVTFFRSGRKVLLGQCGGQSLAAARSFSLVCAFLTTQSVFEPDYGSFLRHITPLIPLMLVVLSQAANHQLEKAAVSSEVSKR